MTFVYQNRNYKVRRVEENTIVLQCKGHPEETFSKSFMRQHFKPFVPVDRNGFREV